jgi:serine/threonine protein phosphatase PrpC
MANMLNIYEPQKASENIVQAVLNKSIAGQDNLTVMIIKLEE